LSGHPVDLREVPLQPRSFDALNNQLRADEENRIHLALLRRLARECLRVRMHGLGRARPRLDGCRAPAHDRDALQPALGSDRGLLLVREAGGMVYDFDGSGHDAASRYTIASDPSLVETGPPLDAALEGRIELLRLSEEEMLRDGYAANGALSELLDAARKLHEAGAANVLVSRASEPAILVGNGRPSAQVEVAGPVFEALDHSGAGDSMFAATGAGLARGIDMLESLRLGMAAGALNATRRGRGTGTKEEIEHLAGHVTVRPLAPLPPKASTPPPDQT